MSIAGKVSKVLPILALMLVSSVNAADYADGFVAAEKGEYQKAAKEWLPLAKKGHAEASFSLALMFHRGLGVAQDEKLAVELYIKAAEGGHLMAQEFLAAAYGEGWFGLPKDQKKADYWIKRLKDSGYYL